MRIPLFGLGSITGMLTNILADTRPITNSFMDKYLGYSQVALVPYGDKPMSIRRKRRLRGKAKANARIYNATPSRI